MKANKFMDTINKLYKLNPTDIFLDMRLKLDNSIKFDCGSAYDCPVSIGEEVAMPNFPFNNTYIEFTGINNYINGVLFSGADNRIIKVNFFSTSTNGVFKYGCPAYSADIEKDGNQGVVTFYSEGATTDDVKHALDCFSEDMRKEFINNIMYAYRFIEIMNCSNVELVNNKPSRLKQSRVKKGEAKLFEFKTLHIKQNIKRNLQKGNGSHKSPRVHLRRGHIRRFRSGKTTWVQPCMVGNSEGIIHKDYAVH